MNKFHLSHKGLLSSIALAFSLFFTLGSPAIQAQDGSEFAGGNGTEENPWQIATKQQLAAIDKYVGDAGKGKYFILTQDLDFTDDFSRSGAFYNDGKFWKPIGSEWESYSFQGTFDGGNHEIIGLRVNSDNYNSGLFGFIQRATIKNLTVSYGKVNVQKFGGIACEVDNSVIENCHVKCDEDYGITLIDAHGGPNGGGLICFGHGETVYVIDSSFKGNLKYDGYGYGYIGGIVGRGSGLIIFNSFVEGDIGNSGTIGGIVGEVNGGANIQNCYVKGNIAVMGNNVAGGLVGSSEAVEIDKSYFQGSVTGRIVGGLLGGCRNDSAQVNITSSYAEGKFQGDGVVGGLIGYIHGRVAHYISESCSKGEIEILNGQTIEERNAGMSGEVKIVPVSAGGLVGAVSNSNFVIENCYSHCNILVTSRDPISVGGLIGCYYRDHSYEGELPKIEIQNSYAMGSIKGDQSVQASISGKHAYLGGLIASPGLEACNGNICHTFATVKKCVAMNPSLTAPHGDIEDTGRIGVFDNSDLANNYALNTMAIKIGNKDVTVTGTANDKNGQNKTAAELAQQSTYTGLGWNFNKIWKMSVNGYPIFIWEEDTPLTTPPTITSQPKSQTVNVGDSVTFSVTATGTEPLSYQWYKDSTPISGATGSSYTIGSAKASDEGSYFVIVSNSVGNAVSSVATLTVKTMPRIIVQPKSQTVNEGDSVTFTVVAEDGSSSGNSSNADFSIPLSNNVNLDMVWIEPGTFIMGKPANEGGYMLYNAPQHQVTLTKGFWAGKYEVTQAQYKAVMGTNLSLKYGTTGSTGDRYLGIGDNYPVYYVDMYDAMEFCNKLNEIEKAAGRLPEGYEYTLPTEAQWEYACRAGTTTAFNNGKDITSSDACPNADEVAWYSHNSNYQTHPVGQKLPNAWGLYDMHGNVWEWCLDKCTLWDIYAVTDPLLLEGSGNLYENILRGGSYCFAADYACSAYRGGSGPEWDHGSDAFISSSNSFTSNTYGFRVFLSAIRDQASAAADTLTYQWYKDGVAISGATGSSYTIKNVKMSDAGEYTVRVCNSVGCVISEIAILTVKEAPKAPVIVIHPVSQTVDAGEQATFSVVATGTEPLNYQWLKNGVTIPGATKASYTITGVQFEDAGNYMVIVSNSVGVAVSNSATLTVNMLPPVIVMHPQTQIIMKGSTATFAVIAEGYGLSYQWTFNGKDIAGANQPVYMIPAAEAVNVGSYAVKVNNKAGSVTSQSAMLWLNNLQMYAGVEVYGPTGAKFTVWYKDDAESGEWKKLTSSTVSASPTVVIDYDSPQNKKRFYKVEIE